MTLAAKLYEMGTLSGGQAAELVGVSKRTFLELLGKYETLNSLTYLGIRSKIVI